MINFAPPCMLDHEWIILGHTQPRSQVIVAALIVAS